MKILINDKQKNKNCLFLIISILLLSGCAADIEEYPPKWVIASAYLPRIEGFYRAGFFELGDSIYSHQCDNAGNMIRMKFDEDGKLWRQIRYETHGCI